jgi:TRAP-type C4-dicarboxylate transport system substrate-binding protein
LQRGVIARRAGGTELAKDGRVAGSSVGGDHDGAGFGRALDNLVMASSRRNFLASTMVSLAAPALVRAASGQAPYVTLKLHHALSSVSCAHANFLAPWARNVEAQSGGRIRIDIFPSMQLGGQPAELFDQARDGFADIVWTMPSETPGRFSKIELFELPFVPPRRALVSSRAVEDFSAEFLLDEFREVRPLCFSIADRGILHAHHPIETVAEIAGLRLDVRTHFAGEAVQALNGSAVPMPSGQLYLAVTRRVIDGCIIPWDMVPALKLDDVLKAHTDFSDYALSTTTYVLAMNKTAYQKLPAELQKIIETNSGQSAAGMAGAMWDVQAKAVADTVSQRGDRMVTLAPEAVAHWRKATAPVIDIWMKQMKGRKVDGEKLLASAHSLFEKFANEPEPQPPSPPPQPSQQPAETKTGITAPAKVDGAPPLPATNSASAPVAPVAHPVATPAPHPAAAPASPTHWWQFWKYARAPAPATSSVAPVAPSPTPASPLAPPPVAAIVKPTPPAPTPPPPKTLDIPL